MPSTPSPDQAPHPAPRQRWRRSRAALRWTAGWLFFLWSLLLAAWLVLHWGILPHLEEWRPLIERRASAALGLQLRIGAIEVRSGGWVPAFALRDVRLLDRDGRVALRLARVVAAPSTASLLAFEPRFAQLLIDDPQLDIRRDAAGRLFVAGIDLEAAADPVDRDAIDWFFEQHEFVIRNGTLRWTDELRGAPPLQLAGVDLVLRNGLRRHELRIDATPPADWGERFSLRGRFTQSLLARSGDFGRWSGSLYAELPRAEIAALGRHVSLPFAIEAGDGALRAWLDIEQGRPRQATVDLALATLTLRLGPQLEAMSFTDLHARLVATRDERGIALRAQPLSFTAADGAPWPGGALALSWQQRQELASADTALHPVTGGELVADRLDLAQIAHIAQSLPLPDALRQSLQALAPRGVAKDLRLRWGGPIEAPLSYRAKARLESLVLAAAAAPPAEEPDPAPRRPGIAGAAVDFEAHQRGGQARLAISDGALVFPGVFAEPRLPLSKLTADIVWRIGPVRTAAMAAAVELEVRNARFESPDLRGEATARWKTGALPGVGAGARYPGQLELSGRLAEAQAQRIARHLPLQIGPAARRWVERAVLGGRIEDARFQVKGDLWNFPFANATRGEFRIGGLVDEVTLAYLPSVPVGGVEPAWSSPWPAFSRVAGRLEFDRGAMHIRDARGLSAGFEFRGVQGGIADLEHPVLAIEGQGRGSAADLLRFARSTPVGEWIGGGLATTTAGGNADLRLALNIPLDQPERATVRGSIGLAGGDLRLAPELPLLAAARGRVDFTQRGFTVVGATARVAGGETGFDGGTQPDGALRFNAQGTASVEALLREPGLGALAPLAGRLRGAAPYRLQLGIVGGRTEWTLTSPLTGLRIDLPAPLAKAAEASWPLRVQSQPTTAGARDALRVELGNQLQARFVREWAAAGPRIERGAIGVGTEPPPLPASGVEAALRLGSVDADAWQAALRALSPPPPAVAAVAAAPPGGMAGGPGGADWWPQRLLLHADELRFGGRRWSALTVDATRLPAVTAAGWRLRVAAEQGGGDLEWRATRDGAGSLRARLSRLDLPPAADESAAVPAPAAVPALDIVVEEFISRGRHFGRVELEAVNGDSAVRPREWLLRRFAVTTPQAQLQGSGRWSPDDGRRMALDFKLDLADSGAFAERVGAGRSLRGGKGTVFGELSWPGSPLVPDLKALAGGFEIALEAGQFLHAEPGAARLLGLFSLQALPRRLTLDFRDLFQEGFAFDSVTGHVRVERGVASTNNLRMRGVSAAVLMEGQADLQRETQDLRVVIVPELNAGTASLAYAAINPAIGLGTLLAQFVLRGPLALAGTREFHVTGPWADPKVERVERRVDAPASAPATPQ